MFTQVNVTKAQRKVALGQCIFADKHWNRVLGG